MNRFCHVFLILFTTIYVELLLGSYGVVFPLVPVVVFYLTASLGWRTGLLLACLAGFVVDCLYGRSYASIGALTALACSGLAVLWSRGGEPGSIAALMLPGAVLGVVYLAPRVLVRYVAAGFDWSSVIDDVSNLSFGVMVAAPLLPIAIIALDGLARHCRYDTFHFENGAFGDAKGN